MATETTTQQQMQYKTFKFTLETAETKAASGQNYGIIKGYASTFGNIDRGGDVVMRGAFVKTIEDYRLQNKQIPMCFQHSMEDAIGGFDPVKMREDEKGLYVEGAINLNVSRGKDVYALVKQGVIDSMSIGYTTEEYEFEGVDEDIVRNLKDLKLWEISAVVVPMNAMARITDVKANKLDESVSIEDIMGVVNSKNMTQESKSYTLSKILRKNALSKKAAAFFIEKLYPICDKISGKNLSKEEQDVAKNTAKDAQQILLQTIDKYKKEKNVEEAIEILKSIKK